jgi:hypothetical protein
MMKLQRMILVGVLIAAIPVFGASAITSVKATPTPTASPTPSPSTSVTETNTQRITNLKTKGTAEIERRITNLNQSLTGLAASTKLTASDKAALTSTVQAELVGLTALKSKLAADTTLAECVADVQSIFNDYRVYALLLPKVRMVTVTDRFTNVESELTALQPQLQTVVDTQKAGGRDTDSMQASLNDMQTKTAAAEGLTSGLVASLLALQPTDYDANHAVLITYRSTLGTALTDIQAANTDAKSVVAALK